MPIVYLNRTGSSINEQFSKQRLFEASKRVLLSPIFWIVLLSFFLLRTILFTSGIPHNGDLTYPTTIIQYQKELFPLWNESTSVSNLESIDRGFSLLLVLFVRLIGGDVDLLSKLYFFIPLLVSGITSAYLAKFVLQKVYPNRQPNTFAIVIAAFMYMISPWVLEQVQAPFYWLAYAVTPGIILLSYRFFIERRLAFGIGLAALWTIASTTPQYTLFSFLMILFIWVFAHVQVDSNLWNKIKTQSLPNRSIYMKLRPNLRLYLKDLKLWVTLALFFVALNAYWIVTTVFMLKNGSVTPGYVFTPDMLQLFSGKANWRILSGTDQWISWWPGQYSPFILALNVLATIALPTISIVAFWLSRKNVGSLRLLYILVGIWIVGAFFALGGNNLLYSWLATSAPLSSVYGWLLRVPGKISYLLWPAYAASVAIVVQSAISYCSSKRVLAKKALIATAVAVLLVASIGYAVVKEEDYFNYYYAPVPVPSAYQQAFSYIGNNLTDARVADFARYENGSQINLFKNDSIDHPENPYPRIDSSGGNDMNHSSSPLLNYTESFESSYTWNPDRIAGYFVPRSISAPNFGYYHFTYSGVWTPAYEHFEDLITYPTFINYTVVTGNLTHLDNFNAAAVNWLPVYGANYILYHNDVFNTTDFAHHDLQVLSDSGCQLVAQWEDTIYLYRVPQTFGRVYALNQGWNDSLPPTIQDVNASGANIYDLKEADPTLWQLNINSTRPFTLIFTEGFDQYWSATVTTNSESYQVSSQRMFGSINAFRIDQTGELHVTLQYKPQVWLCYGIITSFLLLVALAISLIYFKILKKTVKSSNLMKLSKAIPKVLESFDQKSF